MRRYSSEVAAGAQVGKGEDVSFTSLLKAAGIAACALALSTGAMSLLVWHSIWWEAVITLALLPVVGLAVGMAAFLARGLSWKLSAFRTYEASADERVRLVPVNRRVLVNGVDSADLRLFTRTAVSTGDWTQATWRGRRMPSGRKCDNDYHAALVAVLVRCGVIRDHGPRQSGHLAVDSADDALRVLGL